MLPDDMLRFRYIEDVFRDCCRDWSYKEIRTPTLDYLHLFTATGTLTPGMLSKVYSFLDWDGWSGERVVLRPDGTIPVARLYIDNLREQKLDRLFYVTNIFAFEETGKENRERWQCGAEFFGGAQFVADVEIILLAKEVINKLGLSRVKLQLSHAGLVKALIKEFKLSSSEETRLTDRVLEGDWQALTAAKTSSPELDRLISSLLNLKGKSSSFLNNVRALTTQSSPDFKSSLEDFINITTLLDSMGCNYEIDTKAMQGFEYYTGACFQLSAGGKKVGGGGRYDNLVPLMNGEETPACGFALYVDPIMGLLPSKKEDKANILVKGEELSSEIANNCFTLAGLLRNAGYHTEVDFTGREESDFRWVILVSEKKPSPFVVIDCRQKRQRKAVDAVEIFLILRQE